MSNTLPLACVETDGFLVELAYGEESTVPASAKAHLASCERCQLELRALQGVREAATTLPLEEPSSQLDANIFAALDAHLAGESVDAHLKLPEPAPAPARPKMTVLQGGAEHAPAPENRKAAPKRRRVWGPLAAAASVAVVAGSTWLVSRDQAPEAAFTAAKQEAAGVAAKESDSAKDVAEKPQAPAVRDETKLEAVAPPADQPVEKKAAMLPPGEARVATPDEAKPKPAAPAKVAPLFGAGGDVAFEDRDAAPVAKNEAVSGRMVMDVAPSATVALPSPTREAPAAPPPPPPAPMMARPAARSDSMALADESDRAMRRSVSAEAESLSLQKSVEKKKERSVSSLEESSVWTHRLTEGREALLRGDWKWAEEQFASVLQFKSLPSAARREALEGRVTALDALHRTVEADAVAELLAREFPSSNVRATRAKADAPVAAEPASK